MSAQLIKLLGSTLLNKDGEVPTSEALKSKKAVALYFSAHWCPPCRGFTPKLAEIYKGIVAAGKELEVVFVSSDREETAFKEYFGEQPWLALPYADRKGKDALSKKYKVSGIPTLVILDGESGELITKDGRSAMMEDPEGANFPWKPPTLWEALGDEFIGKEDAVELADLRGPGKVIGLYFSAHWCPPCKGFTPKLVETYNKIKAAGKDFEIIFVSSDRDMTSFTEYYGTMPWLAIPQGDRRKEALSKLFEVEGIPALVLIDGETGATITAKGRAAVGGDPEGAEFPWYPKPVADTATDGPDGLNEEACVCILMEGCDAAVQKAIYEAATAVAEKAKAAGAEELYFVSTQSGDQVAGQIRKLTKVGDASATPQMVLMDIPDSGSFYVSDATTVDAASIEAFLAAYKANSLERKQL